MLYKFLVVEDNESDRALLKNLFQDYDLIFAERIFGLEKILEESAVDLIFLDLYLPDGSSIELLQRLSALGRLPKCPIIVLSGEMDITQKILAYSLGVDDFIVKPFSLLELKYKIESKLKRIRRLKNQKHTLSLGNLFLDESQQKAWIKNNDDSIENIRLTALEFKILATLVRNPDQSFSRDTLLQNIWGNDTFVIDRNIDTHIAHLRKKIISTRCRIETIVGFGYKILIQGEYSC